MEANVKNYVLIYCDVVYMCICDVFVLLYCSIQPVQLPARNAKNKNEKLAVAHWWTLSGARPLSSSGALVWDLWRTTR
jgi:hypothetical protein